MTVFKTHMVFIADMEGFLTLCGINDACSESFYYNTDNLVEFGNEKGATMENEMIAQ